MNYGPLIFLGLFLSLTASWCGMVLAPMLQVGNLTPVKRNVGEPYPTQRAGEAAQGRDVYRSLGCAQCHSQQVRPQGFGTDLERGWGRRRTVAQDYIIDEPVLLGALRLGPDLSNLATRSPTRYARSWNFQSGDVVVREKELANWLYQYLYDPQARAPGSHMPAYGFLFTKQTIRYWPAADALALPPHMALGEGLEVVPKPAARQLVAYLMSLHVDDVKIYEAPFPQAPATNRVKKATAPGTNAPAPVSATTTNK